MESLRRDESNLVYNLERAERMYREIAHPSLKMMVDSIATGAAGEQAGGLVPGLPPPRDRSSSLKMMVAFVYATGAAGRAGGRSGRSDPHAFLDGGPWLHNVWGDGSTAALAQQIKS